MDPGSTNGRSIEPGAREAGASTPEQSLPEAMGHELTVGDNAPGPIAMTRREFVGVAVTGPMMLAVGTRPVEAAAPRPEHGHERPERFRHAPESDVRLLVNGEEHSLRLDHRVTLLDALRERLGLSGAKKGCDHGQCGACTVLVNGRRINACLTLAVSVSGQPITTIEGLARGEELHPVQSAFIRQDAFQCGFCTPGQICSAVALLQEGHAHSDEEIRELMSGNICRCGAYPNIVAAIREVMDTRL